MQITPIILLELVIKYGPSVIDVVSKLARDIQAGRGGQPVTEADWLELQRLYDQTAEDIYARAGVKPPSPK